MLHVDRATFSSQFSRVPFVVRHELTGHPLFALERLVALAGELPPASVEYNAGNLPLDNGGRSSPQNGMSAEETIRRIEQHNSWMVLKNVEAVAEYRALLDACLADVARIAPDVGARMRQREAFVFVSSPGAVTPYHMDPEHNFLLQIRGGKRVTVFDGSQPVVSPAPVLEHFYSGLRHRSVDIPEGADVFARGFDLREGDALHIPVAYPHHVQVSSSQYSVSLSVTFRTPDLDTRANVHYFNGFLRARGFSPRCPGRSRTLDRAKARAGQTLRLLRSLKRASH